MFKLLWSILANINTSRLIVHQSFWAHYLYLMCSNQICLNLWNTGLHENIPSSFVPNIIKAHSGKFIQNPKYSSQVYHLWGVCWLSLYWHNCVLVTQTHTHPWSATVTMHITSWRCTAPLRGKLIDSWLHDVLWRINIMHQVTILYKALLQCVECEHYSMQNSVSGFQ